MHNFGSNLPHSTYSLKNVSVPLTAAVVCELKFTKHSIFNSILSGDELSFMLNHICCA